MLEWRKKELMTIDGKTKKLMTTNEALHLRVTEKEPT